MSHATVSSENNRFAAPANPDPAIVSVRGDAFVVRRLELPAGTSEPEVAGFVALQLEELSPFPIEQIYHGYVCASDRRAVVLYAAYRRRFPADQTERWPEAAYVLPDFAGALRLKFSASTVVVLRTPSTLSALYFSADKELPERVASRPLAPDAPPDAVELVRQTVRDLVEAGSVREIALRSRGGPGQRAKGLQFTFDPEDNGAAREVFIPGNECWAMDVRDTAFIEEQRRRLAFDLQLWRVVLGAAALMALLLFGEVLLGVSKVYVAWLDRHTKAQAASVASIQDRDAAATRLEDFARSGVQPFDMLRTVGSLRPDGSMLTRVTAKAASKLELEGWAPDVSSVNDFEARLRASEFVQDLDVRRVNTSSGGSTFSFAITFKSGSFERVAASQP